jgi:hypothetical protein
MKREYQIKYAAENSIRYANIFNELDSRDIIYKKAFEAGAKWSDKNPEKKLVNIEKVCEWLQKEIVDDYQGIIWEDLIKDFRKAMEE